MSSKTKIVVLRKKELLMTVAAVILVILLIILFVGMLLPDKKPKEDADPTAKYNPGVYTSSIHLNDTTFDVEVAVDETHINSVSLVNMEESVATMYPLVKPAMEDLAQQIVAAQSAESVTYSNDNQYTSIVLHRAILDALEQAEIP